MIKYPVLLLFMCWVLVSCKKDHGVLDVEAQPATDALKAEFSDTARVLCHTVAYDSALNINDRYKYFGSNQDPVFGRTDIGLCVNLNILNNQSNISFGQDPNLISSEIVLAIPSNTFVGTATCALSYKVYLLNAPLDKSRLYYTNSSVPFNGSAVVASYTGTMEVMDGKPVIRIPVDKSFANSILLNSQYVIDNATFQSYYKGFYITASGSNLNPLTQQGFIGKCDLDDPLSGFYLYYQNGTPSATKEYRSHRFTFTGTDAVRFSTMSYDKGSIPDQVLYDQLVNKDSLKGSKQLFVKGMGGTRVRVYIPGLKNYTDSFSVSVNRAEVEFHLDPSVVTSGGNYSQPPKFCLLPVDEKGNELYALDQASETDLSRYGGYFDAGTGTLRFNIVRTVQSIMRGTRENRGFYLVIADPSPLLTVRRDNYAERIVFAGHGNASLRPKLNLSFVKLDRKD